MSHVFSLQTTSSWRYRRRQNGIRLRQIAGAVAPVTLLGRKATSGVSGTSTTSSPCGAPAGTGSLAQSCCFPWSEASLTWPLLSLSCSPPES